MIYIEKEAPHGFRECFSCARTSEDTYKISASTGNGIRLCRVCVKDLVQQLKQVVQQPKQVMEEEA